MNKENMLQLIGALSQAAITHYQVENGQKMGLPSRAAEAELKAAQAILEECDIEATRDEIKLALGW